MKKSWKSWTALLLTAAALLALTACGGGKTSPGVGTTPAQGRDPTAVIEEGYYLLRNDKSAAMGTPDRELDPKAIYASLTYNPKMFYGRYRIAGGKDAEKKYAGEMDMVDFEKPYICSQITAIPYHIEAGPHSFSHRVNDIPGYHWMRAYFYTDKGSLTECLCAYTVEGNKLTLTPLEKLEYNEDKTHVSYLLSDLTLEYEFAFTGVDLTLTREGKHVDLRGDLTYSGEEKYLYVDNYLCDSSERAEDLDRISFRWAGVDNKRFYLDCIDSETGKGVTQRECSATLGRNGLFTVTVPGEEGNRVLQYVYFYCGDDGMILTDGEHTYYYSDTYSDRYSNRLGGNLSAEDLGRLERMDEETLDQVVEKQNDLYQDLSEAFETAGISVRVDKGSGEIAMDASVLFGGDSAEITPEGKDLLDRFLVAYTGIIFNDKYNGFIAKTVVEGHTAPLATSTYESGLPLSQERAEKVKEYCVSSAAGSAKLASALEAVGQSNVKPVLSPDGSVDMEASRRVSFRFIINMDG